MQVADEAKVGEAKHGRGAVAVDHDDRLAAGDARGVLAGARDTDSEIELGADHLAGRADLALEREPAPVGDHARAANCGAKLVGELPEQLQALWAAHAQAAGDHPLGLADVDGARVGWEPTVGLVTPVGASEIRCVPLNLSLPGLVGATEAARTRGEGGEDGRRAGAD